MNNLESIKNVDLYLLDQVLKGRINKEQRVLIAGCGKGRNLKFLIKQGYNCTAFDPDSTCIEKLKKEFPENKLSISKIEDFEDANGFDAIVCNAVLHFAESHSQFNQMFAGLIDLLKDEGVLFIRMTSNIGLDMELNNRETHHLRDNTVRYLITRDRITELLSQYDLKLLEPVKSVLVEDLRSMTTLVISK